MGLVTIGPPEEIVLELAKGNEIEIFIETGTFRGGTTRWAAKHFKFVYTIERSKTLYNLYNKELSLIPGVKPLYGDSRDVLPQILKEIGNQKCVFWLDGHWSGGETAGEDDECPLMDELKIISGRDNDIILIDDARLFLSAPPPFHNPAAWPTISEIIYAFSASGNKPFVQVIDDVIFSIPDSEKLKKLMINYSQKRAIPFWHKLADKKQNFNRVNLKTKLLKLRNRLTKSNDN
jgi:hypothetical protein